VIEQFLNKRNLCGAFAEIKNPCSNGINKFVVEIVIYLREGFFKGRNDVTVKNRDIGIDLIDIFFNIIKKISFYLVELNPDDRIRLPLLIRTPTSRYRVIKFVKMGRNAHIFAFFIKIKRISQFWFFKKHNLNPRTGQTSGRETSCSLWIFRRPARNWRVSPAGWR
jgi:hypothetical protein